MNNKKPDVAASWRKVKTRLVLYSVAAFWMGSTCSVLRAQNREYLFKTYCAICHESSAAGEARGPELSALKRITPEHILQALETGAMRAQARRPAACFVRVSLRMMPTGLVCKVAEARHLVDLSRVGPGNLSVFLPNEI